MANFPTLSTNPSYPLEETYEDNVIRSKFEGGYVQTRPRYTRIRKIFTVTYNFITSSDKTTLENFYMNTLKGADYFTWTHPITGASIDVRFAEPPVFKTELLNYYSVTLKLEQV